LTDFPRLGVSTAPLYPASLESTLDTLAAQPWRHVELMPQAPSECRPEFAARLLEVAARRVSFCAIHFPQILMPFLFNPYPAAFEFAQELCGDLGELAGRIGARVVVAHGPWDKMAQGEFMKATLANLRRLGDACAQSGAVVAVENTTSSPLTDSPSRLAEFVTGIDHPAVSFALDITHARQLDQDPLDYIAKLPRIAHVHASDFGQVERREHLTPGDGDIDWPPIVSALLAKGFTGNFVIELRTYALTPDPVSALQRSATLLTPLFSGRADAGPQP
jgi:sugar phosphate isomerase/epimerase